jgi:hypothetical protein
LLTLFAQELKGDRIRKREVFNGFSGRTPAQFAIFLHEICELLELLNLMRAMKQEPMPAIIGGGWVPFLKELVRHSQTCDGSA